MSQVTITPIGGGTRVTADLDEGDTLTGGTGGWEVLERPRQSPAVYWRGTPGREYQLPLMLDGRSPMTGAERSVEPQIAALVAMATPTTRKGVTVAPPVVRLAGAVQVSAESRWVIQDIAWGALERSDAGHVIAQDVTLTLLEYAAAAPVVSHAAKARNKNAKGKQPTKKPKGKP